MLSETKEPVCPPALGQCPRWDFLYGGQWMNLGFGVSPGFRPRLGHLFIVRPWELEVRSSFANGGLLQGCFSEQIKLCGNVLCSGLWYCPYKLHALVTLLGPLHFLVAFSSTAFGKKFVGSSGVTEMRIMPLLFSHSALRYPASFDQ